MKNVFFVLFSLSLLGSLYAFTQKHSDVSAANNTKFTTNTSAEVLTPTEATVEGDLKWYTWEEAVKASEKEPRKIFVDVYTDWCGWCKVMDKKTFPIPEVKAYIEKNFYPVKLDAEQKEDIIWNGNTFNWRPAGRNGIHMLAYSLLEGKTSYPTIVYLNENFERIMISPGYKTPEQFLPELKYAAEEHYMNQTWEEYKAKN